MKYATPIIVADVTMMISAIRVTVENVPELIVSIPSVSSALCEAGTIA